MRRLLMQRVLLGLLTLWLVSVLIFVGTEMLPGDVASAILGQSATPQTVSSLRPSLGLDQPALQRYLMWLLHFLQGDLGTSLTNGRSIAADLMPRLYNTLFLASYAALVVIPLSILLGIASAIWQNSLFAAGRGASAGHRQHRARHAFASVIRPAPSPFPLPTYPISILLSPGPGPRLSRRGPRTLRRSAALASGRYVDGNSGADLRADDSLGARHLGAGVDLHHRRAGRHAGVPAGGAGGARHHGGRVCGSGAAAWRRVGLDYPARDFAQRGAGPAGGIRHALWLHHPVRRRPEFSRPGHSAAVCRLGRHGA